MHEKAAEQITPFFTPLRGEVDAFLLFVLIFSAEEFRRIFKTRRREHNTRRTQQKKTQNFLLFFEKFDGVSLMKSPFFVCLKLSDVSIQNWSNSIDKVIYFCYSIDKVHIRSIKLFNFCVDLLLNMELNVIIETCNG